MCARHTRPQLIAQLAAAIGAPFVLHRPEELMLYEYDASAMDMAEPDVVVVPASTAETAAALRIAAQAGWPVVPRGAGTGLSGGSVPEQGGVVVSLARMDRVLEIDTESRAARVQAGVVNLELSEYAAP